MYPTKVPSVFGVTCLSNVPIHHPVTKFKVNLIS